MRPQRAKASEVHSTSPVLGPVDSVSPLCLSRDSNTKHDHCTLAPRSSASPIPRLAQTAQKARLHAAFACARAACPIEVLRGAREAGSSWSVAVSQPSLPRVVALFGHDLVETAAGTSFLIVLAVTNGRGVTGGGVLVLAALIAVVGLAVALELAAG